MRKQTMENLKVPICLGIISWILALIALSVLGCAPVPAAAALALSANSCLTPQSAARVDDSLNLRLVDALDDAASGAIDGDELTLRLKEALVTYGQELREAVVADTAEAVGGQLISTRQDATAAGGGIGLASAALTWLMREFSWRKKRLPQIQSENSQ